MCPDSISSPVLPKAAKAKPRKPSKPYPDFPLFPHATRRWAKKIRGKLHYFGPWDDPDAALQRYQQQRDDLYAGRTPRPTDGLTLVYLCNHFLTRKECQRDIGEITSRTFDDYNRACGRVLKVLGKRADVDDLHPDDFAKLKEDLAKTLGPVALGNEIQRIRVIFNHAYHECLIDRPVRFGRSFQRPPKKVLRQERQKNGPKMFEADQIRLMLDHAREPLRTMILLGVNCGFGNHDCATLPQSAVDVENGWLNYPRPKTAIHRRIPLWAETIESLQQCLANRPKPKNEIHQPLVFITKYGQPWFKQVADSPVTKESRKLLDKLRLYRKGLGFYALRHTFETIGGETKDQVAVDAIMGHVRDDMASRYRERISEERLKRVTDHVHSWLFAGSKISGGE